MCNLILKIIFIFCITIEQTMPNVLRLIRVYKLCFFNCVDRIMKIPYCTYVIYVSLFIPGPKYV